MLHNGGVLSGTVVIVCRSVCCGRPQRGAGLAVGPDWPQSRRFYDFCALRRRRWLKHTAVTALDGSSSVMTRAAAWWTCLQRGLLLNTNDCWLSQTAVPSPWCRTQRPPPSFRIRRRLFCSLYDIPCMFWEWNNQKMFLICSPPPPPPPSCLLSPPIPSCFHFSSQEVIYCHTHSNSQA